MRTHTTLVLAALLTVLLAGASATTSQGEDMTSGLHWLGHDTFRIDAAQIVYIDPFRLAEGAPAADLILITHAHSDHLSPADIARIRTPTTTVIAPRSVADKLPGTVVIAPGETVTAGAVVVRAVPAYNTDKPFHPKSAGNVGYLITVAARTIYHAGDTDLIPEMDNLAPDIALLPVSGTYVMTADQAADAARRIKPKVAVPMHYGTIVGADADAKQFAKLLEGSGITVVILPRE